MVLLAQHSTEIYRVARTAGERAERSNLAIDDLLNPSVVLLVDLTRQSMSRTLYNLQRGSLSRIEPPNQLPVRIGNDLGGEQGRGGREEKGVKRDSRACSRVTREIVEG